MRATGGTRLKPRAAGDGNDFSRDVGGAGAQIDDDFRVIAGFADALGALTQITDAAFAEYRADPGTIADMRHRFAQWRQELLASSSC